MSEKPKFMTHERIMAGEEYVSYSDYLLLQRERDEARELCRELIDLVAYGLGQSGQEWSLDAMRQAMEKIQKAKSLEAK